MNVKSDEERKSKVLKVRLNDREYAKLKKHTEESSLRSVSHYIYNSILATPIIELTDEELTPEKAKFKEIAVRIKSPFRSTRLEIIIPKICRKYIVELKKYLS